MFFYNFLIKIYYTIFRLKRNELGGQSLKIFLKKELGVLVIIIIAFSLFFNNLFGPSGIKVANAKLSKTAAANLIIDDFDTNIEEELIKENLNPSIIQTAKLNSEEKENQYLQKDHYIENNEDEYLNSFSLNTDGDLIYKPIVSTEFSKASTSTSSNSSSSSQKRTEIIKYTVQTGDTISTIASRFGITINTVLWANNLGSYSIIRPGQELNILPYSGLLYTVKSGDSLSRISSLYDIESSEIVEKNNLNENQGLKIGQELILPGASKITYSSPSTSTTKTPTNNNSSVTTNPVNKVENATAVDDDSMVWPTEGHRITQYFTWSHNGLDIANKIGTPIYAAEAGTVEIAATGWNGGYGNTILINHGNGTKTRYGHLTSLYVKKGDKVAKGENIGTMGSTGRSTGPHIHFEVVINGTRYNPLNYIKY